MEHGQLRLVADKCQGVFSASLLHACGTDAKLCRRLRTITPLRLGRALTTTWASQRVETLADFPRGFHALFPPTIKYKEFYNQMAQPHCAAVIRTMPSRLSGALTRKVLAFETARACAEFRHRIMQEGSSFALHDAVREVFPGRFTGVKPAAGALPTTRARLCDAPTPVVWTPATTTEPAFLPAPAALQACVLLADRG